MLQNLISVLLLVLMAACVKLLISCHMHSVEPGANSKLKLTIEATDSAPELEMQLKNLLWMRRNRLLRADISVRDVGLDSETKAMAQKLCQNDQIPFIERE